MPIQISHIYAHDNEGKFHKIECRTTTPESPRPGLAIINGEDRFFLKDIELKDLGEGRYKTPDGQVLVDPDDA